MTPLEKAVTALNRLASPGAFGVSRMITKEDRLRMQYAEDVLNEISVLSAIAPATSAVGDMVLVTDEMVTAAQDAWIKTRLKSAENHKAAMRAAITAALTTQVPSGGGE